ncbi:hypothetical protein [Paracraurococcus lichenis]|uniref:FCD domain-containing protein n=1 Tax=Paracraurococcus lichenis TaxID=3064888 RepID=A0ABT9EDX1_9PROT|nr:hypothetical protein [Paracraurococcus sp. LOR1-02]MDO9714394.1 hypothetical protein [Paracraurococcus sp. LOR1-02]
MPVVFVAPASVSTLNGLVDDLATSHPDAILLGFCDHFMALHDKVTESFRLKPRGYFDRIRVLQMDLDALEEEIAASVAHTHAGRCAKAEVALAVLGNGRLAATARSALRDFMRADGAA